MTLHIMVVDVDDSALRLNVTETSRGVRFVLSRHLFVEKGGIEITPAQVQFLRDEINQYLARFMGDNEDLFPGLKSSFR